MIFNECYSGMTPYLVPGTNLFFLIFSLKINSLLEPLRFEAFFCEFSKLSLKNRILGI
jgi:hypothetical protein